MDDREKILFDKMEGDNRGQRIELKEGRVNI